MKKIYLLLIFACFAMGSVYSQTSENASITSVDPRIQEVFADQLQTLVLNVPNRLNDLTDILNNRVKIETRTVSENEKYTKLSSVEFFNKYNPSLERDTTIDSTNFNPLKYVLQFHASHRMMYRIDGTDKVVVIYPQQFLKNK